MPDQPLFGQAPVALVFGQAITDPGTRYATNLTVQFNEHEVILAFYEAKAPVIFGSPEDQTATMQQVGSVAAECVARIIVAPGRFQAFVDAMQKTIDTSKAMSGTTIPSDDEVDKE